MDLNEVFPGICVGSCPASAADVERLRREFGITAILNLQTQEDLAAYGIDWSELELQYQERGIQVWRVSIRDLDPDHFRKSLPKCVQVLDDLIQAGHNVYVHCSAGMNRSPSAVVAYLHWFAEQSLDEAVAAVTGSCVCDVYLEAIQMATEDRLYLSD